MVGHGRATCQRRRKLAMPGKMFFKPFKQNFAESVNFPFTLKELKGTIFHTFGISNPSALCSDKRQFQLKFSNISEKSSNSHTDCTI